MCRSTTLVIAVPLLALYAYTNAMQRSFPPFPLHDAFHSMCSTSMVSSSARTTLVVSLVSSVIPSKLLRLLPVARSLDPTTEAVACDRCTPPVASTRKQNVEAGSRIAHDVMARLLQLT